MVIIYRKTQKKQIKPKYRRLKLVLGSVIVAGIGVGLILWALYDSVVFYVTPSELGQQVAENKLKNQAKIRVGGLVQPDSLIVSDDGRVQFEITDYNQQVKISYAGKLPPMFRSNQGIIAEGTLVLEGAATVASEALVHKKLVQEKMVYKVLAANLLTKHDENYKPPQPKLN